ncbi:MAG: right-handed parallel beta-helix repeat-containing protein [Synechococcales bacterium]|nr:right-handed parallel beta-helix repeat-containing protein [Synechococcales bacterium]
MNSLKVLASAGLLLAIASFHPFASAQTTDSEPIEPTGSAADLLIPARAGVGHTSSGAGFDGTTRFEGFVPLRQSPGRNITFFEPRFLLDNDGQIGGNLLFGHRAYSQSSDRIWGGYVSLDNRETDESDDFYQLGLGFETLGNVLDLRINGYVALGDTSQVVEEELLSSTSSGISTGFEGNLLVLSSREERRILRVEEIALSGFDAELGAKVLDWNDGDGDLRGYAGLYFYDAAKVDSTLGWRVGLEVRPVQNVVLGVTLQEDDLFGTNVIGSVTLTFPRVRPRGPVPEDIELVARLGEPVRRNPSIAIETQEEIEIEVDEIEMPLMNPEEDRPYRFIHVTLGDQGGDGTFENPFGTVEDALGASVSDGNDIVYVDAGSNPEIPAFSIPDRVRVLSQGPEQFLAGLPFPGFPRAAARLPFSPVVNFDDGILVRLPLSDDGNFPIIRDPSASDLVTMGDRTVLSGFRIADAPNNAVAARGVENVEIRDNTITNPGDRGIFLSDVSGSVVLFDNSITNVQGVADAGQGILISNTTSDAVEVTIERHTISDTRIGIELDVMGNPAQGINPSQIVEIRDTDIADSREEGFSIEATDLGNQQVTFSDGSILNSGAEGVFARALNVGSQEITIEDSVIANSGASGIRVIAGVPNGTSTAAQEIFINRNRIEFNQGAGIDIEANEVVAQEFAIGDNTIQNNAEEGIRAIARNVAFQEYVTDLDNNSFGISGNLILNNGAKGINLDASDSATLIADIQDNTLSGNVTNGGPDLEITTNANTNDACAFIGGNTSASGIRLVNNPTGVASFFEVVDLPDIFSLNTGTVTLLPDISTFVNVPSGDNAQSCFGTR